jgi:hypothetical protein
VLTSLNLVPGVEHSYTDESSTLIRLSLKPGADREKVVAETRRVVERVVEDRTAAPLRGPDAARALQAFWQDESRAAESAASEELATDEDAPGSSGVVALLLALALFILGLLVWWRSRGQAATAL